MYKYTKNKFEKCKCVTWDDVITKISYEFSVGTQKFVAEDEKIPPSFVTHSNVFPGTLYDACEEIRVRENTSEIHTYISLGENSSNYGRHKDTNNVLIVQSIGQMRYSFDDGCIVTLDPGDSLYIKKGVYHTPIVPCARVTLSATMRD